jgi:hypothetical protein
VFEGEHCGVADEFGADHDGAAADRAVLDVNDVLKVSGGIDTGGAVAGDHARRAGAFAGAGGQHDCGCLDQFTAAR